jgi:CubicO group peptidase (beta-lactamase class C family)
MRPRSVFLPRRWSVVIMLSLVIVPLPCLYGQSVPSSRGQETFPGKTWARASAQIEAGWSKDKLAAARAYADSIQCSASMIVQGGEVVDSWGDIDKKIDAYSVRKSLLSSLYGIYSAEGVIDINQTLEQIGVDDTPDPLTKAEKQARVVDLLRARSGVYHMVDFETEIMKKNRPARGSHPPGTYFYYNNWDYNVVGTIFEKETGKQIGDAFYERIAKPLGMEDFQPGDVFYFGGPLSIHRAYHFEITARDMARFGLLYLRHGRWNGKQIVPEAWVEKSTHTSEMVTVNGLGEVGGYEYLWWVEHGGVHFPEATLPGMFSARGANGHYILVIPTLDLVIVTRTDTDPPARDAKTLTEWADKGVLTKAQFGHLVRLILDARTGH